LSVSVCVCVGLSACVRVCVRVCGRVNVYVCVCVCVCVCMQFMKLFKKLKGTLRKLCRFKWYQGIILHRVTTYFVFDFKTIYKALILFQLLFLFF
jgi:hypothetical protein